MTQGNTVTLLAAPTKKKKKKKRTKTSKTGGSHLLGILGPADKHKFEGKHANACIQCK